jgi:capsular polysaccharide biosynthesis protein
MEREEREIDLLQLARVLWRDIRYIIAAALIMGLLGLMVSGLLMTPIYEASAKLIVNTRSSESEGLTSDQMKSAKNLVETYAVIITSRDVLNQVRMDLSLNMSYKQLKDSIQVQAVGNTQVMEVIVRNPDPAMALKIAEELLRIAPDVLVETVEAGSVKPVEQAHVGNKPVSPRIFRNTVLAAAVGFVLACAVLAGVFFLDTTYKSELDIQNDLNIPVLGVIPSVESCKDQTGYGKKRSIKGSR